MKGGNLALGIVYILIVGAIVSTVIFRDLLRSFPDLSQLKAQIQSVQSSHKISLIHPPNLSSKNSSLLKEKLATTLNHIFQDTHQPDYFYNLCTGNFTQQQAEETCQDSNLFQDSLLTLEQLVQSPSILGVFQYIQILDLNNPNTEQAIPNLLQTLKIDRSAYHLSKRYLAWDEIDENFRDSKSGNINEVLKKLEGVRYLSNCQYTHISCQQITFILSKSAQSTQRVDRTYFINPKKAGFIERLLLIEYGFNRIQSAPSVRLNIWYRLQFLKLLKQVNSDIKYLQQIKSRRLSYILQQTELRQISDWIYITSQVIESFKHQRYENGWRLMKSRVSLKQNSEIGKVNLFAADYKNGLYLPILVSFTYPIILLLKSLLTLLYKNLRSSKVKIQ